jgi:hypothetical protein
MLAKRPYYAKERIQKVGPPFFQWSLKGKGNFNPKLQVITQDLNLPKRRLGVLDVRKWVMELKITKSVLLKKKQVSCNPI